MSKLKVVWICHFSNEQVRDALPLAKRGKLVPDFAPWITNMIQEFKSFSDIDLHIIAPHIGLNRFTYSYKHDGINYHFFKADLPILHRNWPHFFCLDALTGYLKNRLLVRMLLKRIKPHIINLIGAENSYYSSTVLGIKDVPVLISIQGIYSNPDRFLLQKKIWAYYFYERKIHKANRYFGVSAPFMPGLIERDSPNPVFLWNRFPLKIMRLDSAQDIRKEYDFVFFARLTPVKGPDDALEALALVKEVRPDVTMRIMGPPMFRGIVDDLKAKAAALGIERNVNISGGFPLQEEMLMEAAKGRFYVLPTKIDTIPGTILEAVYLGLPVVSYKTGDIPLLNSGDTRVLLSERGDIQSLATHMLRLLEEPRLGEELSEKALHFVEKWFDNSALARNFVRQYHAVIANFHKGEPFPPDLLYENYLKTVK